MGLLLYLVIFTGQASLGTRGHLIHNSNDALAASLAGSDGREREQFDRQSGAQAYTCHDVATRTYHVSFNKKIYNIMHNMVVKVSVWISSLC